MLIDKYVKYKPQRHRNLLFSCFVDFRKPSTVYPTKKPFDKLRKEGVQGRFLDVLISTYANGKSAVKTDNKLTESFTCYDGVKQGYMLSPTLFNLYLSDLLKFLNTATDVLENVKSCKNLGLIMSPFGNLNLARRELKKVALKAL